MKPLQWENRWPPAVWCHLAGIPLEAYILVLQTDMSLQLVHGFSVEVLLGAMN